MSKVYAYVGELDHTSMGSIMDERYDYKDLPLNRTIARALIRKLYAGKDYHLTSEIKDEVLHYHLKHGGKSPMTQDMRRAVYKVLCRFEEEGKALRRIHRKRHQWKVLSSATEDNIFTRPDNSFTNPDNAFANTIVFGDTTKVLPQLIRDGKQYHVIIADPPYNIGKDFGKQSEVMPIDDYVTWVFSWLINCRHLLTDDGLLYLYGLPEIIARISVHFPINEQRWLVWHYTNKTVPSYRFWQRSHETILCLWKPNMPRADLEVDQIREPYTKSFLKNAAGKERKSTPSRYGSSGKTIYKAHEKGALPRDVLKIPALAGGAGRSERWFVCKTCGSQIYPPTRLSEHRGHDILKHPTQKPMELTKRLIQSRINGTGGRILIPFAGSGSECIVAQELGAEYLGIEINSEYADFANKWLEYQRNRDI